MATTTSSAWNRAYEQQLVRHTYPLPNRARSDNDKNVNRRLNYFILQLERLGCLIVQHYFIGRQMRIEFRFLKEYGFNHQSPEILAIQELEGIGFEYKDPFLHRTVFEFTHTFTEDCTVQECLNLLQKMSADWENKLGQLFLTLSTTTAKDDVCLTDR